MIEDALFAIAKANAGVTALIGTSPCRAYPVLAPEPVPAYPFVAYSIISETNTSAMGVDTGVLRRRVQMDCYDTTATGAATLAEAIKAAFKRYSGTVSYSGGSTVIEDIYILGQTDLYDLEARKFKRAVDLDVVFDG